MTKKHLRKLPHKRTVRDVISNLKSNTNYTIVSSDSEYEVQESYYVRPSHKQLYGYPINYEIINYKKHIIHRYGNKIVKNIEKNRYGKLLIINIYLEEEEEIF